MPDPCRVVTPTGLIRCPRVAPRVYRRNYLAVAGVAVASAGCLDRLSEEPDDEDEEPADVVLFDHQLVREAEGSDDELAAVVGSGAVVGDRELSLVEIRAEFFDDEGDLLGSTVEVVEDVSESPWTYRIEFAHRGERAAAIAAYGLEVVTAL